MTVAIEKSVPKYQMICSKLKARIVNGLMVPGDKLPKEKDLADQFGVSVGCVRDALKRLSDENLISKVNGVGSFVAEPEKVIKTPKVGTVAFYTDISRHYNPRFMPLIHGVSTAARLYGLGFQLIPPASPQTGLCHDKYLADLLQSRQFTGLIVDDVIRPHSEDIDFLTAAGIDFIVLGELKNDSKHSLRSWSSGNWFGQILGAMLEQGFHKIGIVTGVLDTDEDIGISWGRRCITAYRRVMRESFNTFHPEYIRSTNYSVEGGYVAGKELFALSDPPEVIISADDYVAVGVIKAALDQGLSVPNDVKVWGNGDFLQPSLLSSVAYDLEAEGADAVAALVQLMEDEIPEKNPERTELVFRVTTEELADTRLVANWVEHFIDQYPIDQTKLERAQNDIQVFEGGGKGNN